MTKIQATTLRFIAGFWEIHGYSPSIREIMAGIGSKSTSHVHRTVVKLTDRGYIRRHHGQRGIEVIRTPWGAANGN